jgi:hypothetical protein
MSLVDGFGPNALAQEKAARRDAKTRVNSVPAQDRRALDQEPSKVEDETEDDVEMDNDASGSDLDYTCVDEDDEAHTSVSSTTQKEARRVQVETPTTSENTEAAGFGSDPSSRTESGNNEEPVQAESN